MTILYDNVQYEKMSRVLKDIIRKLYKIKAINILQGLTDYKRCLKQISTKLSIYYINMDYNL